MGISYLAEVISGWTGAVAVTIGATTTTVTPRLRESVASLWARVIADVYFDSVATLAFKVSDVGFAELESSSSMTLTLTGNCATRLDMATGPYAGTYVATDGSDMTGVFVPSGGVRLGLALASTPQAATSGGTYGAALWPSLGTAPLTLYGQSDLDVASLYGVYDVAADAGLQGRVRIDGVTKSVLGRRHTYSAATNHVEYSATCQAVVE